MVTMLRLVSVLALVAAGLIFGLCAAQQFQDEEPLGDMDGPSIVERWREANDTCQSVEQDVPLVEQAKVFALHLSPPPPPKPTPPVRSMVHQVSLPRNVPAVSPPAPTPKFRLHGTLYRPARPERSMALIWELDGQDGDRRWVKEGAQLGHFVIHEIRQGSIVCRSLSGETTREMLVERGPAEPSLIRQRGTELAQGTSIRMPVSTEIDANMTGR